MNDYVKLLWQEEQAAQVITELAQGELQRRWDGILGAEPAYTSMYVSPGHGTVTLSDVPAWIIGVFHKKLFVQGLEIVLERLLWDGTKIRVLKRP